SPKGVGQRLLRRTPLPRRRRRGAAAPWAATFEGNRTTMRILLVADIHANWPALQAVDEPHDLCFCLGDLVDYCLEPSPCIDWVRQRPNHIVRGNHDHGVVQNVAVFGRNGFKYLTAVTRVLTRERLTSDEM